MKIEHGDLLSPTPIRLTIGTIKKHKLIEIADITFGQFGLYQSFLKMMPESYYNTIKGKAGQQYWEQLSSDKKDDMKMFDLIPQDEFLQNMFVEIFNFFFVEDVIYRENVFVVLKQGVESTEVLDISDVQGVILDKNFQEILDVLQQICCIYDDSNEEIDESKFKNKTARKIYEKIKKAKQREKKKSDKDMELSNIISAVSNRHPTVSPINVWDLTLYQLYDSFNRQMINEIHNMNSMSVSVWGDKDKKFNDSLWYKNNYK